MKKRKPQKKKINRKFKKPKFINSIKIPPVSKRICLNCKTEKTFKYNRLIGYSECVCCGSRAAKKPK